MIEFFKHILGICGDGWHPNIFHFLITGAGIFPFIKYKLKEFYDKSKS
jgi:hypothetical protein